MSTISDYRIPRERMLKEHIMARGIKDKNVLNAMLSVPRHLFVPEPLMPTAYDDRPLPIGAGQTISQPYIVALMSSMLEAQQGMTVLEIGTGSGYQAAVLHAMGLCVFSVERLQSLYFETRKRLDTLGLHSIRTHLSDGTLGWQEMAPFDRILVAAGGPSIPEALIEQLADDGIMILPVGQEKKTQDLIRVRKTEGKVLVKKIQKVSFVDLVGTQGW